MNNVSGNKISFKNWILILGAILSLLAVVTSFISQINSDTLSIRVLGSAGYVVLCLLVVWMAFFSQNVNSLFKKICLCVFFILSAGFFIWAGTLIEKSPIDPSIVPIERSNYSIFDYYGANSPSGSGTGYLTISNSHINNKTITIFSMDYTIPQAESYAGFVVHFNQPIDISTYKFIRLAIRFKDDKSRLKFNLTDAMRNTNYLILGDKIYGDAANNNEQTLDIPIKNFPKVIYSMAQEMEFSINGSFVSGSSNVEVSDIRLIKQ